MPRECRPQLVRTDAVPRLASSSHWCRAPQRDLADAAATSRCPAATAASGIRFRSIYLAPRANETLTEFAALGACQDRSDTSQLRPMRRAPVAKSGVEVARYFRRGAFPIRHGLCCDASRDAWRVEHLNTHRTASRKRRSFVTVSGTKESGAARESDRWKSGNPSV